MATYILFWNPAISSYNQERFENDFWEGYGVGNWSFNEYEKIQPGDRFYMVRCGEGTRIHYADIYQNFTINSFEDVKLLTPDELANELPDFNWFGGHSGRLLNEKDAKKLDALWDKYLAENPNLIEEDLAFRNQTDYPN